MPLYYGDRFEENPVTVVGGPKAAGLQPTIAVAAGFGSTTTAVFTANSNDRCGQITVTSGGTGQAAGTVATVTFAQAFSSPPVVIVSGVDTAGTAAVYALGTATTTTFTIAANVAPSATGNPKIQYVVLGSGA